MRERSDKGTANHISVFDKVVKSIEDDLQVRGGKGVKFMLGFAWGREVL